MHFVVKAITAPSILLANGIINKITCKDISFQFQCIEVRKIFSWWSTIISCVPRSGSQIKESQPVFFWNVNNMFPYVGFFSIGKVLTKVYMLYELAIPYRSKQCHRKMFVGPNFRRLQTFTSFRTDGKLGPSWIFI